MFKKILVIVYAISALFSSAIFAVEQETNQQIMLPITAGTIKLQNSDFDSQGKATIHINNFGPGSCPSPYVSPAAKYPWITAHPSEVVVGDAGCDPGASSSEIIKSLVVVPGCNQVECYLAVEFSSEGVACSKEYPQICTRYVFPATRLRGGGCVGAQNGYLKISYVAYCSTQPI